MEWDENRVHWLALASFDAFGARTLYKLWSLFKGDGVRAWQGAARHINVFGLHPSTLERFNTYRTNTNPEKLRERLDQLGILFVLHADPSFPFLLSHIADPPFALFVRGELGAHAILPIAVVGTRHISPYGKQATEHIVGDLAAGGMTIVSGLALGIDAVAHRVALSRGGVCIAVLGSGCDDATSYPRSNLGLLRDILAAGGAIVSEYPPGTPGLRHHFPMRNRIIAGLAQSTLVIEAATDSGSLITAHLALQYDREVFAVPGPINDVRSGGTNKLLKLGARVCTTASDILPQDAPQPSMAAKERLIQDLSSEERALLNALRNPMHVDDLARQVGLPVHQLAARLSTLELRGLVHCQEGDAYVSTQ